jgi:EAL domain-containing protein (putative c-di-GMP-specific phosphodiesterase class I)
MACINLSAQSITDPAMHKYITELVIETAVSPRQVCFEIAETAVVANITAVTAFMLTLRNHGFRFSLDDVGSGPSCFAYLRKLPVDYLKIDGGYIRDILSDPVDRAMVRSISELGRLLGKETIAEYMETGNLFEELKKLGIHFVQGHASAPLQTLDEFARSLGPHLRVVSS